MISPMQNPVPTLVRISPKQARNILDHKLHNRHSKTESSMGIQLLPVWGFMAHGLAGLGFPAYLRPIIVYLIVQYSIMGNSRSTSGII